MAVLEHALTLETVTDEREAHRAVMPTPALFCPFREAFVFFE